MKVENQSLKKQVSKAGVAEMREELRNANVRIEELSRALKAREEDVAQASIPSPEEATQASQLGLHKFQLSSPSSANAKQPVKSIIHETLRFGKYLGKLLTTIVKRAANISDQRGGSGWSAYEQLETLMQFAAQQTTDATEKLAALAEQADVGAGDVPGPSPGVLRITTTETGSDGWSGVGKKGNNKI
jgi:DNA-binding transcriptional MerR regulator